MTDPIVGYYIARKEKLLKGVEATCELMRISLVTRYGHEFVKVLEAEMRRQYERLIPDIPCIRRPRARALNTFLLISAQELAVFKASALTRISSKTPDVQKAIERIKCKETK